MEKIYLDHAAATPLDPTVWREMQPDLVTEFANPSSLYQDARVTRQALEDARSRVAKVLGAKTSEIVWTSGGTESVNLAIQGILRAHPGASWVTSAIEHDAVLALRSPLEAEGHSVVTVGVKSNGIVDKDEMLSGVTDQTVLVSLIYASNEIGTIQSLREVAQGIALIRGDRHKRGITLPLYLHSDACQAAGYLDLSVARLGVDLLSLNGSKIYGPRGSGVLYIRQGTIISPLLYGGGQERGRRSGTENVAAAVGFARALELACRMRESESKRLVGLRDDLIRQVTNMIPGAFLNGHPTRRLPTNVSLTFPGIAGQTLVLYLDKEGIMASTGSACSAADQDPSHVLLALGLTKSEAAATLRLTLGRATTAKQLNYVAERLPGIVERLRELA